MWRLGTALAAVAVDGGVQDPEGKEQGKKQDGSPGLPETRLWPVQQSAWKDPTGGALWRVDRSSKAG